MHMSQTLCTKPWSSHEITMVDFAGAFSERPTMLHGESSNSVHPSGQRDQCLWKTRHNPHPKPSTHSAQSLRMFSPFCPSLTLAFWGIARCFRGGPRTARSSTLQRLSQGAAFSQPIALRLAHLDTIMNQHTRKTVSRNIKLYISTDTSNFTCMHQQCHTTTLHLN